MVHSNPRRVFKFRDAVVTDVGKKRNENQDAFSIAHTEKVSLYIVADGMGGARGGATASSLAVNIITGQAFTKEGELTLDSLKAAVEKSNKVIHAKSLNDKDLSGMGTTLVALAIRGNKAIVAHVGDSRIYRIRGKAVEALTKDHTLVQELVDSGAIAKEDADSHPIAHMLTRSLGPVDTVDVEIRELQGEVKKGDFFLLCSDGLYNLVSDEEICEEVSKSKPQDATDTLLKKALERGGSDNITIEIIEVLPQEDAYKVSYPTGTTVDVTVSGEVEITDIESLIKQVSQEDMFANNENKQAPQKHSELELDELFTEDKLDSQGEVLFDDSSNEFKKIRSGLMVVVGLMFSALVFSYVKYTSVKETRLASNLSADNKLVGDFSIGESSNASNSDTSNKGTPETIKSENNQAEIKIAKVFPITAGENDSAKQETINLESVNEEASPIKEDIQKQKTESLISKVAMIASDKQIGEPPVVVASNVTNEKSEPVRPIVWENEQRKLDSLKQNGFKEEEAVVSEPLAKNNYTKEGKTKIEIVIEKIAIRENIKDIDAKLSFLKFDKEQSAESVKSILNSQLKETNEALTALEEKQEKTITDIKELESSGKKTKIVTLETTGEIKEAGDIPQKIVAAKKNYELAQKKWRDNPRDLALASQMSAYSRELESLKREGAVRVETKHAESISDLREKYAIQGVTLEDLERRQASINRHLGYLAAHTKLEESRVADLRDKYLAERVVAAAQLQEIKGLLSDDKENAVRERALILKSTEK